MILPMILPMILVETMGLEPTTSCLQSKCSSQLSYVPETQSIRRDGLENRAGLGAKYLAAVSVEYMACNPRGLIREQEEAEPHQIIGCPHAL